jgi:hypothetical protein
MKTNTALSDAALAGPEVRRARRGIPRPRRTNGLDFPDRPQRTSITEGRGFIPSVNDIGHGPIPLAQTHPRKPLLPSVQRWRFLIANARLEFRLSDRKRGPLKISNRERIAIFCFGFLAMSPGKKAKEPAGMPAVQRTQSWRRSRMGDGAAVCGWHRQECLCYWKRNKNF